MKILHTADWHLGHRLLEQSQQEEQVAFLDWIYGYILAREIDVLLISGDIFDTAVPSTQSQKMYYDFLIRLKQTNCQKIIITGGNHDAPGMLNAPKTILSALSIEVVGKATEDIADEVFKIEVGGDEIIVAAVPYLRDRDIRKAAAGETFEQIADRYKYALINHYKQVAAHCETIKEANNVVIAMGHLFAIGGSTSESENVIYVGGEGDIGVDDFPKLFDYIALGHLHRPQKVGGNECIRYSGSPNVLSFSEVGYDKKVVLLEVNKGAIQTIQEVTVPAFRQVRRVTGDVATCIEQLQAIDQEEIAVDFPVFKTWVEVVLDNEVEGNNSFAEIDKAAETLELDILKRTFKKQRDIIGLEKLIENSKDIKQLSPLKVFEMKCEEQHYKLDKNSAVYDAFCEALELAKGQ